ncbi:MAG: SH3 domain-containing protein [Janthinobacterium lividum]
MRLPALRLVLGLGALAATALPALAAPGFATGNVNLRAGPGTGYPQVVVVPNSAPVEIFGCLQGYGWCDVGFNGVRGWVSAGYLQYAYQGRRVPFANYTAQAGVPVVAFRFGDYWGEHYRDRPWFADQDRWGGPRRGPGFGPAGDRGRDFDRGPGRDFDHGPGRDFGRGPGGPGFDRGPGGPGFDRGLGGPGFDRGPGGPGGPGFDRGPGRGPDRGPPDGPRGRDER